MWAWMLHRVTGVALILFVGTHVFASFFMQQTGNDFATTINIIYESWVFQVIVAFIVIFHGLNGMRVVLIDFWPNLGKKQAMLWRIQMVIFAGVYIPSAIIMLSSMFGSH